MTAILRQSEEMEQLENAVKPGPCLTQLEGSVGRGNEKVGEKRESVPHPRKATRPKSSSMKKEWSVAGQAAKLRRKSAQSARTTAEKAIVCNARDQARASIAES
jgi:hypothetical protein